MVRCLIILSLSFLFKLNWVLFCASLWSLRPTLAIMKSDVSQTNTRFVCSRMSLDIHVKSESRIWIIPLKLLRTVTFYIHHVGYDDRQVETRIWKVLGLDLAWKCGHSDVAGFYYGQGCDNNEMQVWPQSVVYWFTFRFWSCNSIFDIVLQF